jgi:hypothetical protein
MSTQNNKKLWKKFIRVDNKGVVMSDDFLISLFIGTLIFAVIYISFFRKDT